MIQVSSIKVSPRNITLKVGSWYYGAIAEIIPADATSHDVTWSSSNPDVATVNMSSGYIYAKSVGEAKIYATATNGSGQSDYIAVTVSNTVKADAAEPERIDMALNEGEIRNLSSKLATSATATSLNWESDNPSVAVADNGVVYAQAKGRATITATATDGSGSSSVYNLTVTDSILVESVTVNPASATLAEGKSVYLHTTVCPLDAANKCVTWSSSNENVATVNSESGLVYAKTEGSVVITATAVDGSGEYGTCTLTVIKPIPVTSISVADVTLNNGETKKLSVTVSPENATNKIIHWCSSRPSIVKVNKYTGRVTARCAGQAYIYVAAQDGSGVSGCCRVTVKQSVLCSAEEEATNKGDGHLVADPVDVYSGSHIIQSNIMTLFGGQGLKLMAHHNSSHLVSGELGLGWWHNYEKHLQVVDDEILVFSSPAIFARYVPNSDCGMVFTCTNKEKNGYVLTVDQSNVYPYVIDCNSQYSEYYNIDGKLVRIVDHHGFETLISYTDTLTTITDTVSGKKIYLAKNSDGRVVRVYDDASRQAVFTYSDNLLLKIQDVNGYTITYTYDENGRIKAGTDSENICYFENTYDEYGRVATQKDAIPNSLKTFFVYDENSDKRTTTNRNGKNSVRLFDCDGLLISYTDENGNTKTYEYDSNNNIKKETDARGCSVIKSYNRFHKPTVITDKNGNKTYITYDMVGNVTNIKYPAINGSTPQESFVYNSRNQIIQHTDRRGTVTVYTYDTNGMPATKKVGSRPAEQYNYENGLLKSHTDARGNTTTYGYNAIGQMTSKTDADNNVTRYEYDCCGNLLKVTDANGKTIVTTYDGNYQKTSVKDANGNTTTYSYNGNMKNNVISLPDGNCIRYTFDGEDRPITITDQAGNVTTITYDDGGRMTRKKLPDNSTINYAYDAAGNVLSESNPKGGVTSKTYDGAGNVLTMTDAAGNTTRYEYNAMSKVTKVINAMSGVTQYRYSAAGDLLSETDALGKSKTYTYDAYGNRLTATDARGNSTTYTYDANNNLLTVTDALNRVTTYTYNALNQLISIKDAKNNVIRYGYDALGRRTTITDAKNNVFTTYYDGNGNVIETTDANGNTITSTTYNSLNLPASVTDSTGKTTSYTYTGLGKVETATDSMNHTQQYTYNSRGQNTSVRDAADKLSSATYDALGNVTSMTGPLGGSTSYTYDNMGRLTSESTVSDGSIAYTYNSLNLKQQIKNAREQSRQFSYDSKGRITGYTSPEGSVSYTYDANDNVLTVTDSNGTVSRSYDALNRVVSCTDTYGKTIGYEYDSVGNLIKITYPDNTEVNYSYDANHNLVSVVDWANRETTYNYDVNNRVIGVVKPDGSTTTTAYDSKQRITSTVERTSAGAVITGFEYTYDALSRIVEEKVLANSTKMCYTYDELSRVTARTIKNMSDDSVIATETYTYDAAGNIVGGSADTTFLYDIKNRLTSFNGNSVSYDLDGNMLSNGTLTFTYDSANRLTSAGGHTYTYNGMDVRIRNLCAEEDTTYTYNTNCKLSQLLMKTTNNVVTKYVYGRGLIGEETNSAFKTYHFDYRGSTIAITDASGTITDTFAYDTYGKVIARTGASEVIFTYNGRDGVVTDDNGLIYMRARYYSPDMRRFINADIVRGEISNAVTLNRYAYANGNPISFVDPFGLSVEKQQDAGAQQIDKRLQELIRKIESEISLVLEKGQTSVDYITKFVSIVNKALQDYSLTVEEETVILEYLLGITQEEHYGRLQYTQDFPYYFHSIEAQNFYKENWVFDVSASCHQFTAPNRDNFKIVSEDGKYEVIYNAQGYRVDDVRDIGTYNFSSPNDDKIGHFMKDVLPWYFWGNAANDTTTREDRLKSMTFGYVRDEFNKVCDELNRVYNEVESWFVDLWRKISTR